MRTAIYARVSDDKLKDDGERRQDINRQVDKLKNWFESQRANRPKDLEILEPLTEDCVFTDDGLSAYKDDYQSRPAFVRMLREIRGHHFQQVLVEDLTRWSRRLVDGLVTLKDAGNAGCTIVSLAESEIDVTTSSGWMKAAIFLMMAEWASRIQSEKVKSGMERRANDQRHFCESCQTIHLGRHPDSCRCTKCLEKKGRVVNTSISSVGV